ncbi:ATP-DEPENDENT HELICASE PCRA [Mycoplasmopsis pulmonis]|uniref:DNA 3'-5' helicase n=1 Tax=Mycoplasmopsis pulmonis (strain UAB CTIP) TaxID=272635 RepID=Q98PM4_MYCPU|nr:ATP-dependent helicase [Mycoplasmopsis pulmonis]MDZ7293449.1 ATP-dependent helicase [Mycoplasmopsis pulmonis]CAC13871.1 ATP-DEPENDENT HELICASE PCRA [Mycoplasmopsis pulmonis]VEU68464.1 ATP-dependent DNA helicase UvrD/PcrA [Mycoplasmopsis pulmonis]
MLSNLNQRQKEAVVYTKGPLRIIAGAGSGKTRVITSKIAYLIEHEKIAPWKILGLTFTNKAAREMKERALKMIGPKASHVELSTFHSLCNVILKQDIDKIGYPKNFEIVDESDKKQILKGIYLELAITTKDVSIWDAFDYIAKMKKNKYFSSIEEELDNENEEDLALLKNIYKGYVSYLKKQSLLDFDDLIILTYELFSSSDLTRQKWASKYDYVLVDEFQDTSFIQYEIVKVLASNKNITIVGDPDQNIYSWRGSDFRIMLNFDKDFENTKTINFEQNYRSTPNILEIANKLIKNNKNRMEKNLFSTSARGADPLFLTKYNNKLEAKWIVEKIIELSQQTKYSQIAIFTRTAKYSRDLEEELFQNSIPYVIYGGTRFFEREIVKDLLAYLRLINNSSEVSFIRVINTPRRSIGPKTLEKIITLASEKGYEKSFEFLENLYINKNLQSFFSLKDLEKFIQAILEARESLKNDQKIAYVLEKLVEKIDYKSFCIFDRNKRKDQVDFDIDQLYESIAFWEEENPELLLDDYLNEISLLTSGDQNENSDQVSIMTAHSAKGLEFDYVFITGLAEKHFPHFLSLKSNDYDDEIEEERRLCYVAVTRAKKQLFLTAPLTLYWARDREKEELEISRFIEEMGLASSQNYEKRFSHKSLNDTDSYYQNSDYVSFDWKEKFVEQNYAKDNQEIKVGDLIKHDHFGVGKVVKEEDEIIHVKMNDHKGIKTFIKNHKSISKLIN